MCACIVSSERDIRSITPRLFTLPARAFAAMVGTVARTTSAETKGFGYSIYYTLVNIGGAVGPILALQVRENLGISYVLVMSSITSLILVAAAYSIYAF